jgi:hypothetical protein
MTLELQAIALGSPHWSMASGLRVPGAATWAGGPLTLYALLGLSAIFVLVTQLSHRRAAIFAALVAGSAPLYYLHARCAAAQIAGMSAIAIAVAGLGVAALGQTSRGTRFGALGVGILGSALGLLVSGVVGIALPVGSVTLTCLLTRWPRRLQARAAALLWFALAAALIGAVAFAVARASVVAAAPRRSFDFVLVDVGLGFFPWSAALPFAIAAMAERPARTSQTEHALRLLVLLGASLSYVAASLSAQGAEAGSSPPFVGLVFLAGAVGLWLSDIERGARVSRPVSFSLAVLFTLLALDFVRAPDKRALVGYRAAFGSSAPCP